MKGEGDVLKHLSSIGYRVCHVQTPIDEFDFSVKNFSVSWWSLFCYFHILLFFVLLFYDIHCLRKFCSDIFVFSVPFFLHIGTLVKRHFLFIGTLSWYLLFVFYYSQNDFKDGVRLVRLIEVLTQTHTQALPPTHTPAPTLDSTHTTHTTHTAATHTPPVPLFSASQSLRLPALSRLQKLHNVGVALKLLYRPIIDTSGDPGKC